MPPVLAQGGVADDVGVGVEEVGNHYHGQLRESTKQAGVCYGIAAVTEQGYRKDDKQGSQYGKNGIGHQDNPTVEILHIADGEYQSPQSCLYMMHNKRI